MTSAAKQEWFRTVVQLVVILGALIVWWGKMEARLTKIETTLPTIASMEAIRIDLRLIDLRLTRLEEETKREK